MNEARQKFWQGLNRRISERDETPLVPMEHKDTENDNWRPQPDIAASTGIGFNVHLTDQLMVYLIPRDRDLREGVFSFLAEYRSEINAAFDSRLEWKPSDQSTKIVCRREGVDIQRNRDAWADYQGWLIETAEEFDQVFRPYLREFESL